MNETLHLAHDFALPADGWCHIVPRGSFAHASGVRQVIDELALASMVRRFEEEALVDNFPGLLVDFDHFSHDGARPTEAAGWLTALQARPDGLWARIRWSDTGEAAVRGGRYRLVSPVWLAADCARWRDEGATVESVRPLRLHRVALTNDPNLTGLTPLTNRRQDSPGNRIDNDRDINPIEAGTPGNFSMEIRTLLLQLLNLEPSVSDTEMAEALAAFIERHQADASETETLRDAQAESDLDTYADVITDRPAVKEQLLANRRGTLTILRSLRRPMARRVLYNRAATGTPASFGVATEEARAKRIAARARELQRTLHIGFTQAFNMAQGERI